MKKIIKGMINRIDGWENLLTGLGVQGRDKRLSSNIRWNPIREVDAEELYAQDDIAKKIVNKVPEEALRQGFKIKGVKTEEAEKIMDLFDSLCGSHRIEQAWKWGRLFGGSAILLVTDKLQELAEPIELEDIKQIKALTVLNRWELVADYTYIQNNVTKPDFGHPTLFSLQSRIDVATMQNIHRSHLIVFPGVELTTRLRMRNSYWDDSVLTQTINAIMNYSTSHDTIAQILQDFRVAVFRMKDLAEKIGDNEGELVKKRLELVNISKSILNAIVIDADSEEFEHKTTSVAGLQELMNKVEGRLAAAADMPRTILFGESPTGMGGSGRHEQDNFYDDVKAEQENYLKPRLMKIIQICAQTINVGTEDLDIEFNPLYQQDDKEVAETRKLNSDSDVAYINSGVLDPREVAMSRFGGEKYGMDIQLDDALSRDEINPQADPSLAIKEAMNTKNQTETV